MSSALLLAQHIFLIKTILLF